MIKKVDDTTCETTVNVQVSPTFFGWLAQFGGKMKVLSPGKVVEQYQEHITTIVITKE